MYPSIPVPEAIENAVNKLKDHPNLLTIRLSVIAIEELLRVVLHNTYFEFNGQIYKQIKGLPMGSSLSGVLAILFVDKVERIALQSITPRPFFRRYVDDCFALVKNRSQANALFDTLNNINENIKYEIEFPAEDGSLSLLDFRVSVSNNKPSFSFYKKPVRKNIFVNFRSHLPLPAKRSIIKNERKRIAERCSLPSTRAYFDMKFDETLTINGYPDHVIRETNKVDFSTRVSKDVDYIKLPYINDDVNSKLKRIFRQEGLNIRLSHKTRNLRHHLSHKKENVCSLTTCAIKNSKLCHRRNVVYKVVCRACHLFYIGSTIRHLHLRIHEHITSKQSSIHQHLLNCTGNLNDINSKIDVYVIGTDYDEANLRLREAILISWHKPKINSKVEMEAFREFLYL